jgi:hypothetical protein
MRVDQQYVEWYHAKYPKRPRITTKHLLPVQHVLQGHPESPRLWEMFVSEKLAGKRVLRVHPMLPVSTLAYMTDNLALSYARWMILT